MGSWTSTQFMSMFCPRDRVVTHVTTCHYLLDPTPGLLTDDTGRTVFRKVAATVSTTLVLLLAGAGAAQAEGSFNSYISGWFTGITSRTWSDNNTDSAATTIRFSGCTWQQEPVPGSVSSATVMLVRVRDLAPDSDVSAKTLACTASSGSTGNWGDVSKSDYKFRLTKINGSTTTNYQLAVKTVAVKY
jgi:hypothetical protein